MVESIIKDWSKLRDWEVIALANRGYELAIEELNKRQLSPIENESCATSTHGRYATYYPNTKRPERQLDLYDLRRKIES